MLVGHKLHLRPHNYIPPYSSFSDNVPSLAMHSQRLGADALGLEVFGDEVIFAPTAPPWVPVDRTSPCETTRLTSHTHTDSLAYLLH